MKKYSLCFLLICPFFIYGQSSISTLSTKVLVRLNPKVNISKFHQSYSANARDKYQIKTWRKVSAIFNIYAIESTNNQQLIKLLKQDKAVLKIAYDMPLRYRNTEPNDMSFDEQWNMKNIRADLVWSETTGGQTADGKKIVIGVLEKGIDPRHEDLVDNIWVNQAEIPNNNKDDDDNGYIDDYGGLNLADLTDNHTPNDKQGNRTAHGTQVAGVIGAKGNNEIGVAGINWDIDLLLFSKVDFISQVIEAHEYAYNLRKQFNETNGTKGAFIIAMNHSFGFSGRPEESNMGEELCEMIDLMGNVGILTVAATYNQDIDVEEIGDLIPSCSSDFVIGITSSNERNERAKNSGYGNISIDLAAPGERIYTLNLENGYGLVSGTSMATPLVTGTIGLLYSLPCDKLAEDAITNPATTAKFIKAVILNSTRPMVNDNARTVTGGILDAFGAMEGVQLYCGNPQSNKFEITQLYPNPATSDLTIIFKTPDFEPYQLIISNTLGQIVYQKNSRTSRFEANILTTDISHFASGFYFLTLRNKEKALTKQFIVEQ